VRESERERKTLRENIFVNKFGEKQIHSNEFYVTNDRKTGNPQMCLRPSKRERGIGGDEVCVCV